jgi:uncharacterized protein DUF6868
MTWELEVLNLKHVLWWCVGLNYAVVILWFGSFTLAHDWMYRVNSRWFKLSPKTYDALNWAGIAVYKLGIILLNLVPLAALYLAFA